MFKRMVERSDIREQRRHSMISVWTGLYIFRNISWPSLRARLHKTGKLAPITLKLCSSNAFLCTSFILTASPQPLGCHRRLSFLIPLQLPRVGTVYLVSQLPVPSLLCLIHRLLCIFPNASRLFPYQTLQPSPTGWSQHIRWSEATENGERPTFHSFLFIRAHTTPQLDYYFTVTS